MRSVKNITYLKMLHHTQISPHGFLIINVSCLCLTLIYSSPPSTHDKTVFVKTLTLPFISFRLKFSSKGVVTIAGFSEPSDADVDAIELRYPRAPNTTQPLTSATNTETPRLSADMARYLMQKVGNRFCELVEQEKEVMMWMSPDTKIV